MWRELLGMRFGQKVILIEKNSILIKKSLIIDVKKSFWSSLVLAACLWVGIWPREFARTIENISRIRMDVARASGDEIWTKSFIENNLVFDIKNRFSLSKMYFTLNSTPSPSQKRSRPPFESYLCSLSF